MKTAISIPDQLFRHADRLAKQSKLSRSELYARALNEYIQRHSPELLTQQANDLAAATNTSLPPDLRRNVNKLLREVEW